MSRRMALVLLTVALLASALLTSPAAAAAPSGGAGPRSAYDCKFNFTTDAFTGAYGTASAIGWEGNEQGVVTCLGGTFLIQDRDNTDYGFGIYDGERTTWADAQGWLPAQVTTFHRDGATVAITEFADRVVIGSNPLVAVYARVAVANPTNHVVEADPKASPALVPLSSAPDAVAPHHTVFHDYVIAAERFSGDAPWPSDHALVAAGGFDRHFAHMADFWRGQVSQIAQITTPDGSLDNAYRSGFVTTQIARSGNHLDTGVNGYDSEFSHDVVGILTNLFSQGSLTDARALLLDARDVVGAQGQYVDGTWTYAVPWAAYLMKSGDIAAVKENFDTEGPAGASEPSIEDTAHEIAADRTGPSGTMEATDDIDTQGYWTVDDFEALLGLAAYRYLAQRIGNTAESSWAGQEYDSLLAATNATLDHTMATYHLDYLPCAIDQPNTANRCKKPMDANWASPLGKWAWDASLLGATVSGPGLSEIDATYDYGFDRLRGRLPANTFGGFPDDWYSSAYNAANGIAGLASSDHRSQGIASYEFMISHSQSGPWSWWESSTAPSATTPWVGDHPAAGQGASPHAWGIAGANQVLLDSLVAESANGTLLVGRGVPDAWLRSGRPIAVTNFPANGGHRLGVVIHGHGDTVSLVLQGDSSVARVAFELPAFVGNVASAPGATVDEHAGTVTFAPSRHAVTVHLRHAVG